MRFLTNRSWWQWVVPLNIFFSLRVLLPFHLDVLHLNSVGWVSCSKPNWCTVSCLTANLSSFSFSLHSQFHLLGFGHPAWLFHLDLLSFAAVLIPDFGLHSTEPLHLPFFLGFDAILLDFGLNCLLAIAHLCHVLGVVVLGKDSLGFRGKDASHRS